MMGSIQVQGDRIERHRNRVTVRLLHYLYYTYNPGSVAVVVMVIRRLQHRTNWTKGSLVSGHFQISIMR
jgi:hypothetical protein